MGRRIALFSVEKTGGILPGAILGLTLAAIAIAPLLPSIMGKAVIFCGTAISLYGTLSIKKQSK